MTALPQLAEELRTEIGPARVLTDRLQCRTYECDGLSHYKAVPAVVVLAEDAEQVRRAVRLCARHGVPFVARGSGTGLSGGALPQADGVLIVLSRMRAIRDLDIPNQRAVVEPGVINLWLTREAAPHGYYYAPDPSSQQVCSIGGNLAENSGGAHCLKYGFTANHVTGAEVVLSDGSSVTLGGKAIEHPGYDLLGVLVGSEGTLGIATSVTVRLVRQPEEVQTLLAGFASVADAAATVSDVIAGGVLPAAIEMMDALAIEAAEEAVHCDYPADAEAVLIVELDGPAAEVSAQFDHVDRVARRHGALALRVAADADERALMWKGRKSAFAAVGRISPDYIVQDGVIPRTALPEALAGIGQLGADRGIRVANVFHAGDGNLHPLVLYDESVPGQAERAHEVAGGILDICLGLGGSITGEHGVGIDKAQYMGRQFSAEDLDTMQLVRCAFDPGGLSNPGKIFPTPRLCGELPGPRKGVQRPSEEELVEVF
jgi:glycolate oxidase